MTKQQNIRNRNNLSSHKAFACIVLEFICAVAFARASEVQLESYWSEPQPLNALNTPADEFAPAWNRFEDLLYYNSNAKGKSIFIAASRKDSVQFSAGVPVAGDLSAAATNYSYISFQSRDVAYLSAFSQYDAQSQMNIFSTIKRKASWARPEPVKSLAGDNFSAHPTVSPDGSILIFSSNRGSSEDTDLWISFRTPDGDWSQPIPIQELNTTGNEITPMLQSDDTLYFASDGLGGEGGYDLFMSVRVGGKWQSPLPLKGLNTSYNESDFTMLPGGVAVFASNRPGSKGGVDLWASTLHTKAIPQPQLVSDLEVNAICGVREIRTELDFKYSVVSINPYITIDEPIGSARKFYPSESVFADTKESILAESKYVIASRLFEQPAADITIETQPATENESDFLAAKADSLRLLLTAKYGIAPQRISTARGVPVPERKVGRLQLGSSDKSILAPLCVGSGRLDVSPESVNVLFEARPREIVEKWDARLFIDNEKEKLLTSKATLPDSLRISIGALGAKMLSAETIDIYFNVIDKTGQLTTARHSMLNSTNISRKPLLFRSGDKSWESFTIYALGPDDLQTNPAYTNTLTLAAETATAGDCKTIEIVSFAATDLARAIARAVEARLMLLLPNSGVQFRFVSESLSPLGNSFSAERVVEIRVVR